MSKIYITGHKNPDTDSICAALAYQELKRKRSEDEVEAIRLGDLSQETKFVLDYFGVAAPRLKDSMKPQVKDLKMDSATCISKDISIYQAFYLMQQKETNNLPVIDADEKLIGIVSLSDITEAYMNVWDDRVLYRASTGCENIAEALSASFLTKPEKPKELKGKMCVFAMDPKDVGENILKDDIVILGDRVDAQKLAIEKDVAMIILSGHTKMDDDLREKAEERGITVLTTQYPTFIVSRLLPLSVPVAYVMTKENLVTFNLEDGVDEVKNIMANTRYRSYPVVDARDNVVGSISRFHLISSEKKKLILVDHNEKNQSVIDIDTAEIIEIIDHHRVANISTTGPVYFRNEPVGSTSTIVSKMYFEEGIMPSKKIAGLLSAAIISDTLFFKSPTTTEEDKRILDRVSKIACIDPEKFAMEMFKAGTSLEGKSANDLLNGDVKTFMIEGEKIRVAQIFTMDLESLAKIKEDLIVQMEKVRGENSERSFVLILTDIFKERSKVIVSGSFGDSLAKEFDQKLEDFSFIAEGLLSRKKQMIPKLTQAVLANK